MQRVLDDANFELPQEMGPARCRVQILRQNDRSIVLLTQRIGSTDGRSLANAAEDFAQTLRDRYFPDANCLPSFISRYVRDGAPEEWLEEADDWIQLMTVFDANGRVDWTGLDAEDRQVLHLFAQAGRGDVQDPPPLPRLREERWLLYPTRALPDPQRLFRAQCMQNRAQQAANRILQPLALRACHCDYHLANWRAAAKLAIAALRVAHLQTPRAEEGQIGWLASEHLRTSLDRPRTIDAARSLLGDPIVLTSDGADYINGQHRSISMRDQCVRMVPLTMMLPTSEPAPEPAREFSQD